MSQMPPDGTGQLRGKESTLQLAVSTTSLNWIPAETDPNIQDKGGNVHVYFWGDKSSSGWLLSPGSCLNETPMPSVKLSLQFYMWRYFINSNSLYYLSRTSTICVLFYKTDVLTCKWDNKAASSSETNVWTNLRFCCQTGSNPKLSHRHIQLPWHGNSRYSSGYLTASRPFRCYFQDGVPTSIEKLFCST